MSIVMRDDNFNQSVEFMLNNPMWRQANPMARQQLKNMFMETSLDWLLDDTVQIYNIQAVERLSEINKRTLLIIGSEDSQPIKEIARVLESNISMIQVVTINDTGHLPNLDKPEIFNKYILDFLLNTN
jgi:pimeloyl-ACP methyl ester carboxylesterase